MCASHYVGADAVCKKPLALNPWNIDGLQEMERDTERKVDTILQLRLHPGDRLPRGAGRSEG